MSEEEQGIKQIHIGITKIKSKKEYLGCEGFLLSFMSLRFIGSCLISILSGGLVLLASYWFPNIRAFFFFKKCNN
jgi:hypothetical protein